IRLQGEIYEKIIQEVISASQNDFEENGVQQQTLMELQQVGHVFPSTSPDFITHILAAYSPEAFHALLVSQYWLSWLLPAKLKRATKERRGAGLKAQRHALQDPNFILLGLSAQMPRSFTEASNQLIWVYSWQHKMSQRDVAQMPWDPKPAPPPPQQPPPQQQAQQPAPAPVPVQNGAPTQHQTHQSAHPVPQPKIEPGTASQPMHGYSAGQGYPQQVNNQMMAQQRAASLLQQQFGQQASASLNAMQQRGIALPGGAPNSHPQQQQPQQQSQQQPRPQGLQLPGQPGQAGQANGQPGQVQQQRQMQAQYAQQMRQQTAHQQPQIKTEGNGQYPQQHVNYSQTDGADEAALDEWNRYMTERRKLSSAQVNNNDRLMRRQIEDLQQRFENGLLLPMDNQEHTRHRKRVSARRVGANATSRLGSIPQLDGEDEEDEDAINSDLDSSSDEAGNNADEEDEEIDHVLCTYDKVQRVKNKWKCTLKDGIMSANGKEYLFHKAQGEFEW
ncbi:TFIIA-domain-containing protein, partial [Aureobasidium pullulans]